MASERSELFPADCPKIVPTSDASNVSFVWVIAVTVRTPPREPAVNALHVARSGFERLWPCTGTLFGPGFPGP
jgi:hypothetical protein